MTTLLAFNFSDARLAKLRFLCLRQGITVQPVNPADFGQTLGALCGLTDKSEEPAQGEGFSDEMLVMVNLTNQQANRFLTTLKQARFAPVRLKAMLTPTNAEWDCFRLHRELCAERDALAQHQTPVHHQ